MPQTNKSRYAILGLLSFQEMSGYELKKNIERSISYFWHEDFPQIYPMLKQLEAEGLTTGRTERQEGRPERRVYTLTDQGRDVLYQWLALPPVLQVERNELLLKCFFGAQTTPHINVEHIQGYRAGLLERIAILEQTEQTLKEQFRESRHLPYWLATTSYGLHAQRALVAWCDETLQRLQSLAQEH